MYQSFDEPGIWSTPASIFPPGTSRKILQGVQGNEANLVQGVVIVVALAFIIINIVVDMLYLLINPRIRTV